MLRFSLHVGSLCFLVAPAAAQTIRINGPLAPGESVRSYRLSPDGGRVVYWVDGDVSPGMWIVPSTGGEPKLLFHSMSYEFTADSRRVVFSDLVGLRSIAIDGRGGAITLNDPLFPSGHIGQYAPTADGRHVVYIAPQEAPRPWLYAVPVDRSQPPRRLNGPLVTNGDVSKFWLGPDSSRVVYRAFHVGDVYSEIYSVPIDGSAPPVRLQVTSPTFLGFPQFADRAQFSPDGQRVIFELGAWELYSAPLDGSRPTVRIDLPAASEHRLERPSFTPSGSHVVYQTEVLPQRRLFVVPSDGSGPSVCIALSNSMIQAYTVTPDETRVVYWSGQLFVAPLNGSAPPLALTTGGRLQQPNYGGVVYELTPDGERVVFCSDFESWGVLQLYSVPVDGSSPPVRLNPLLPAGSFRDVFRFWVTHYGVLYVANQDSVSRGELYHVPADGSAAPTKISPPLLPRRGVTDLQSGSGGALFYRSDRDIDNAPELFCTFLTHPVRPAR